MKSEKRHYFDGVERAFGFHSHVIPNVYVFIGRRGGNTARGNG